MRVRQGVSSVLFLLKKVNLTEKTQSFGVSFYLARLGVFAFFCKYRDRKKHMEPSGTACVRGNGGHKSKGVNPSGGKRYLII